MLEIRIELGNKRKTDQYIIHTISIIPKRMWLRTLAKLRRLFSKDSFEVNSREGEDSYLYTHLVKQEITAWAMCPDTFDQEDFDAIVERRGFTQEEAQSILDALKWLGYRFKVTVKPELCKVLTA